MRGPPTLLRASLPADLLGHGEPFGDDPFRGRPVDRSAVDVAQLVGAATVHHGPGGLAELYGHLPHAGRG